MVWVGDFTGVSVGVMAAVWVEDLDVVGEMVVVGAEVGVRSGIMAVFWEGIGDEEKIERFNDLISYFTLRSNINFGNL